MKRYVGWVVNVCVVVMKKCVGFYFCFFWCNRIGKIFKISICYNFIYGGIVVVVCFVG